MNNHMPHEFTFCQSISSDALRDASEIKRFLELSAAGARGTGSRSEIVAHRIACALNQIGDDMALLDTGAIASLCAVVRAMGGPWSTQQNKEQIFNAVKRAAHRPRKTSTQK